MKSLLWGLVFLVQILGRKGCFEEERLGLLEIKEEFVRSSKYGNTDHLLPSWVDDRDGECCEWERVTCNSTTGHVTHLSLHNIRDLELDYDMSHMTNGFIVYSSDIILYLNVSLFETFKELRSLDLSSNSIGGWIENEGTLILPPT